MRIIHWKHIALWIILIGVLVVLFSVASADRVNLGQSGWVKLDDGKYYGDENGYAVTGHQQIDDDYYYFDTSGLLRTEWHVVHCTPGSSEEKNALLKGLPYDNGQKRVVGTSITDVNEKADWIIKNYISSGMTEREKARILHNWLIYNAHYDYTYSNYYADGVLITGAGVCDSYTRAYCLLLSKVGIENKRYVGHNGKEGHAWNLVKIDGQWYHVDCTWDDPDDSGTKSYSHCETTQFFLVKDTYIKHFHDFYEEISADSNYVRWVEMNDKTFFYGSDGKRATGMTTIDNYTYFFSDDGVMQKGLQRINGDLYMFSEYTGQMKTDDWYRPNMDTYYYFGKDGKALTGLQTIDNQTYYFSADGIKQTGWQTINGKYYYFDDIMITGWQTIDDHLYYFTETGALKTGPCWFNDNNITYYITADGTLLTGLQKISGKTYYFSEYHGQMLTGWIYFDDESGYRYFNDKGEMQTGWFTEEDNTYYFFTNGLAAHGLQEVDGALYLFSYYDGLQKNTWWDEDGNEYYFSTDGKAATGFIVIDGTKYYFDEQHVQQTGWVQLNETEFGYVDWYLGLIVGRDQEIGWDVYRFDENGILIGRVVSEGYYSPEQLLEVKAEKDENGSIKIVTTGKVISILLGSTGWLQQDDEWYYGDENGNALTGIHSINGIPYCFNEQGELATGWTKVNNKWYYSDSSGIAAHNGWQEIGNVWYYFYADGEMATGWLNDGGTYYYMKNDGSMQTGWVKDKGKWYYLNDNGTLKTGWLNDNGNWYYLRSDGQLATGWICDGGAYYYMSKSGLMLTGWIEDSGKWYYMNESGVMQTGWLKSGNNWYYLRSSGELASGWQQISGQWYYFTKSGAMASGEWIEDKEAEAKLPAGQKRELWYWFDDNGKMAVGWKEIHGQWEMFSDGGEWLYSWNGI